MSALLALLVQATASMPPADWSTLPELPLPVPRGAFDPSAYVRGEVAAGRCRAELGADGSAHVAAPLAVLIDAGGAVARIVPQAIGCPTVEQYTAGYVSTLARRSAAAGIKPGWHRYVVTYRWRG